MKLINFSENPGYCIYCLNIFSKYIAMLCNEINETGKTPHINIKAVFEKRVKGSDLSC